MFSLHKTNHVQNSIETAITKHATATYGDLRSPILANFQKTPRKLQYSTIKQKFINNWENLIFHTTQTRSYCGPLYWETANASRHKCKSLTESLTTNFGN